MYARTKEWDLGEVSVDVDYDHRATPRRFEVTIALTGDLTEEQLARLEKVAATCPVRRSIEAGIEFDERIDCVWQAVGEASRTHRLVRRSTVVSCDYENIRSCPSEGLDPARRPRRVLRVGRAA